MKFKYRKFRDPSNPLLQFNKQPIVEVRLAYGANHIDLDCLVDSGAGECLFTRDIADILGINLQGAPEKEYFGITNQSTIGQVHPVQLRIKGFSQWVTVEAGFIAENQIGLLGQAGFFDHFQIIFEGYRKRFEIKPRPLF